MLVRTQTLSYIYTDTRSPTSITLLQTIRTKMKGGREKETHLTQLHYHQCSFTLAQYAIATAQYRVHINIHSFIFGLSRVLRIRLEEEHKRSIIMLFCYCCCCKNRIYLAGLCVCVCIRYVDNSTKQPNVCMYVHVQLTHTRVIYTRLYILTYTKRNRVYRSHRRGDVNS